MATRANITSVEAIEAFRAKLIIYISKARPTLEEINSEIARTRTWVEYNQRTHWRNEFRKRSRVLEEAKANLFSARISSLREVSAAEQAAYTKAKRACDEAEEKLRVIKRWDRDFENKTEPLARQLEKLHTILADDMNKAVVMLTQILETLADYSGLIAPSLESEPEHPPDAVAASLAGEISPPDENGKSKGDAS